MDGYTVEVSSSFAEFWRYNVALMCGCFDGADTRTGFVAAEDAVADVGAGLTAPPADYPAARKAVLDIPEAARLVLCVYVVPHTLPALWRAEKIGSKTAKAGFDWSSALSALGKLEEEVQELRAALEAGAAGDEPHGGRGELGDLLFITAKVAQMSGVDPEDALHRACDKFDGRFRQVEALADKPLGEYAEAELVELWKSAKKEES